MDEQRALCVTVAEEGASPSEIDNLTTSLRRVLNRTAVSDVTRAPATGPAGSKGAGAFELGALVVNLLPSVLRSVVDATKGWLSGHPGRSITMSIGGDSIVVTHPSVEQQRLLVEAWLQRHSEGVAQADLEANASPAGS
jgi:hypothetical protein